MYHHKFNTSTLQTNSSCIEYVDVDLEWMLEWHIDTLNFIFFKFKNLLRRMKSMINEVVIICMGQFNGECAQFRMDVINFLHTL